MKGCALGRSTLYGWLDGLRELFEVLVKAMLADARAAPYLCTDATGVLVQAPDKCSRGHFWVVVAPGRHVIFAFSSAHDSAAVDKLLDGYDGYVVADAHAVYDHLYGDRGATEVGCWSHTRSYFFKTLGSEPEIPREFLANLRVMFMLERKFAGKSRKQRERMRQRKVKVLVDRHLELCRKYEDSTVRRLRRPSATRSTRRMPCVVSSTTGGCRRPTISPSDSCAGRPSEGKIGSLSAAATAPRSTRPLRPSSPAATCMTSSPRPTCAKSCACCPTGPAAASSTSLPATGSRPDTSQRLSSCSPTTFGSTPSVRSTGSTNAHRRASTGTREQRGSPNAYRLQAKLNGIKTELRRRMHRPIRETGAWLRSVVSGHFRYYAVPMNRRALYCFREQIGWLWMRALRRRGQKHPLTWERMRPHIARWLPRVRVYHPYPLKRFGVIT